MSEPCPHCKDSERPGFIVFAKYYDRLKPTDVIGEYELTSGTEWARCMYCRGTAKTVVDPWRKIAEENPPLTWLLKRLREIAREAKQTLPFDPKEHICYLAADLIEAAALQRLTQSAREQGEAPLIGDLQDMVEAAVGSLSDGGTALFPTMNLSMSGGIDRWREIMRNAIIAALAVQRRETPGAEAVAEADRRFPDIDRPSAELRSAFMGGYRFGLRSVPVPALGVTEQKLEIAQKALENIWAVNDKTFTLATAQLIAREALARCAALRPKE